MKKTVLFCIGLLLAMVTTSCKKETITEVKVVHDTVLRGSGPAMVRFVSLMSTSPSYIILRTSVDQSSPIFTSAYNYASNVYTPVKPDSSFTLYAHYQSSAGTPLVDSVVIPGDLEGGKLWTGVIYQTSDNHLVYNFYDDSVKLQPATPGYGYIRFVNGLSDYPEPSPAVNLYVDTVNGTPLFENVVLYQDAHDYVPIKAGNHNVYVRGTADQNAIYQKPVLVAEGGFYTARLTGSKSFGSDLFSIDPE